MMDSRTSMTIKSRISATMRMKSREKDEIMSGGEGTNLNSKQRRVKKGRRHFTRQREKVLRGNEDPLAAVFSWGVSHHMRELGVIQQPKMLLADDFKAYSKLKVENHAFNRAALPGHYKVKEYCPLVFRALRDRFGVSEDDYTESLSLHQIEPLITHDEIEKIEDDEIKKEGKFRKRDILRSFCGRFTVSLVSSEDIEQLHQVLPNYHAHIVEHKGETLLPNWLGLYRVGISNRSDRYLLVTRSITDKIESVTEQYRLKGNEKPDKDKKSEKKEKEKKEKHKENFLKDQEWASSGRKLCLAPEDEERFKSYLERDVPLLQRLKLINYSLYVGLPSEEEEENVQDDIENHDSGHDGNNYDDANSDSDEHQNDDYCFNNNFVFKRQNGGLVYLAINDILNHYDTKKKAAHAVKTAKHGREDDKKNTPEKYGKEFVEHVQNL